MPWLAYMPQGGSDASNTDPFATEPAAGEEWLIAPPYVMLLLPGDLAETGLSTDRHAGAPWIMCGHPLRAHHDAGGGGRDGGVSTRAMAYQQWPDGP